MEPRLEYCGNSIEIKHFSHSIEDEKLGNPYNCSFAIKVRSGQFAGLADGCEADYQDVMNFAEQLERLIAFQIHEVTFEEIGYGGKLSFQADRLGHIQVSGKIYGNAMTHSMEFEFPADQTVFPAFIAALKAL